jgi:uncharacterized protein (TIGR02145 family)
MAIQFGPSKPLPSVIIGTQTWTLYNLDATKYRNGDDIPQITDNTAWLTSTTGAWCYYNNNSANGAIYGKLYNWYAVNDPRGLAPVGYHIPSDAEYTTLANNLGGASIAGGALKETGTTHWVAPNTGATNSSGFTALGGGSRSSASGNFFLFNQWGIWWSSTQQSSNQAYALRLYNDNGTAYCQSYEKYAAGSVRCIKD